YREGPAVLRPYKARFRKMLADRDPGVRRVAAWSLAHTEDMDVAPLLIDALVDPDDEVVAAARLGLQVLSRKIEGLGPPTPSTAEQRRAAAQRWRDWFNAVRPLDLDDPDRPSPQPPGGAASTTAGARPRSSTP
ncbi:MAG TPA: HEAT repeat domain-containing protein, partial [Isosphaeraceae bacterium]|nr:HEAT repeat domain-containing protein [Isosphaeraceae bacterium]